MYIVYRVQIILHLPLLFLCDANLHFVSVLSQSLERRCLELQHDNAQLIAQCHSLQREQHDYATNMNTVHYVVFML